MLKQKNIPCQELPLSPASSANRMLKPQVSTTAKGQPGASRFSVEDRRASSNATGGHCLPSLGAGDDGQGCASHPCSQSPVLHFHGLTIGTTKALAQLLPGTALCSSFPQPENSSIKLSRNLLRTPKGTVVCVCSGQR